MLLGLFVFPVDSRSWYLVYLNRLIRARGFRRCGATEDRLHIYKRPCCTFGCGPRYEPLSWAPFAQWVWA
jgi:hypothetical protein